MQSRLSTRLRALVILSFFHCGILLSVYSEGITFQEPQIIKGHVVNNSYFYGEITIGVTYANEAPFSGLDKEAFYSLDDGVTCILVDPDINEPLPEELR